MLMDNKDKCLKKPTDFIYDEACLEIHNFLTNSITVFGQYVECNKCDYQALANLTNDASTALLINTKYSMRMHIKQNDSILCEWNQELLEHYRYGWNLTEKCPPLYIIDAADNSYIPILSAFIILFFFGTIWYMVKCIYKCTKNNDLWRRLKWGVSELETDLGSTMDTPLVIERPPARKHQNRIKSIDVFRGVCIMMMIFVNYGGGQYWFFKHSAWNGLTVADLVFPWFLWIMGLSLSVSLHNKLRRATPRRQLVFQVLRRSIVLFCLGLMLNSHGHVKPLSSLRYFGVLQRIGLTYLLVAMLEVSLAKRLPSEYEAVRFLPEVLSASPQWIVMITLIVIHTCLTFLVNVPGCGKGYLGPGGLDSEGHFKNCTGGVAGYIDRSVLGDHIYTFGTYKYIYEVDVNYDPEGILGTFTAAFLVYLGVHAGRIHQIYQNLKSKVICWTIYGVFFSLLGGVLCGFSKNGGPVPINKNLWSLSFVFSLGGIAFLIFAFLYVVVDVTRKWGGRPFFYPGMNPLILYVLHELFRNTFPIAWIPNIKTHAQYLGMNLWGTAFWVCISIYMYKVNWFVTL